MDEREREWTRKNEYGYLWGGGREKEGSEEGCGEVEEKKDRGKRRGKAEKEGKKGGWKGEAIVKVGEEVDSRKK